MLMKEDGGNVILFVHATPPHPGAASLFLIYMPRVVATDVNYRATQFTQATRVNLQGQQLTRICFREWLRV